MATTPAFVQVTEGAGKRLAATTYTENGQTVFDQKFVAGEPYLASYTIVIPNVVLSTANSHMGEVMAGSSLNVRIRKVRLRSRSGAAAVTLVGLQCIRLSTAGTGGTVVTPAKLNPADAAAGCTAMSLPTAKGTETTTVYDESFTCGTATILTTTPEIQWPDEPDELTEPLIIPAGTSNGICIKNPAALATATVDLLIWVTETSF